VLSGTLCFQRNTAEMRMLRRGSVAVQVSMCPLAEMHTKLT
jgi:hypothetical protein